MWKVEYPSYIIGNCRTNLDGYEREEWPTQFYRVPEKGEYIQSTNSQKKLTVVNITHRMQEVKDGVTGKMIVVPAITVELHRGY